MNIGIMLMGLRAGPLAPGAVNQLSPSEQKHYLRAQNAYMLGMQRMGMGGLSAAVNSIPAEDRHWYIECEPPSEEAERLMMAAAYVLTDELDLAGAGVKMVNWHGYQVPDIRFVHEATEDEAVSWANTHGQNAIHLEDTRVHGSAKPDFAMISDRLTGEDLVRVTAHELKHLEQFANNRLTSRADEKQAEAEAYAFDAPWADRFMDIWRNRNDSGQRPTEPVGRSAANFVGYEISGVRIAQRWDGGGNRGFFAGG